MWHWIKISQSFHEKKICDSPKEWMLLGLVATATLPQGAFERSGFGHASPCGAVGVMLSVK